MFSISSKPIITIAMLFISYSFELHALVMTESVRSLPQGAVEFSLSEKAVKADDVYYTGSYRLGAAISERVMAFYAVDYIYYSKNGRYEGIGDSLIGSSFYVGGFSDNLLHLSLRSAIRLPTGPSVYANSESGVVSHGINELNIGASARYNMRTAALHASADYIFRQADKEQFYSSGFFKGKRLTNDAAAFSAGINSIYLYPVVPFFELRAMFPITNVNNEEKPKIAGGSFASLDLSAGIRFFYTEEFSVSASYTEPILRNRYYFDRVFSIEASVVF